jgi:adenylate kinase
VGGKPVQQGPLKIIIAGAPASGKGTQCENIRERYGVVHLSTGDMLRAAVAAQTDIGKQAKEYMDSGMLVPDEVIIGVVSHAQKRTNYF